MVGAFADILCRAESRLRGRTDGADINEEGAAQAKRGQQQRVGADAAIVGLHKGSAGVAARAGAGVESKEWIGEGALAVGGAFDANGIVLGRVQSGLEPVVVALQLEVAVEARDVIVEDRGRRGV